MRAVDQMNLFIILALFVNVIYGCSTDKTWLGKHGMQGLAKGEYLKHRGVWCRPGQNMNATNVNDAKLECSANPECRMFDDKGGRGERFTWCENTAQTRKCPYGNVLYSKNNKNI